MHRLFSGKIYQVVLGIEEVTDADDFVAASISQNAEKIGLLANKCLFISDEDAWRSMATLRNAHVLLAHLQLDLEASGKELHLLAKKKVTSS